MATKPKPTAKPKPGAATPRGVKAAPKKAAERKMPADATPATAQKRASMVARPRKTPVVKSKKGPGKSKVLAQSHTGDDVGKAALPDASALPVRWQVFVNEYMVDLNGTRAAIRSGYAPTSAGVRAAELLGRPDVAAIVRAMLDDRLERIRMTRDRVLAEFENMAEADANELSELRRVCCRHCWGEIDAESEAPAYQFTPAEFVEKKAKWDADRERMLKSKAAEDIGEFPHQPGKWYDKRKPVNERCTECFGDGIEDVFLKDTRNISRRARAIYGGVKEGKDGIEIKTYSKEAALQVLAKHHKLYEDSTTVTVSVAPAVLEDIYEKGMSGIQAAKEAVVGRGEKIRGERREG